MANDLRVYDPPTGDAPLDAIEQALVRALVPILVRKIREDAASKSVEAEHVRSVKADSNGHFPAAARRSPGQ